MDERAAAEKEMDERYEFVTQKQDKRITHLEALVERLTERERLCWQENGSLRERVAYLEGKGGHEFRGNIDPPPALPPIT